MKKTAILLLLAACFSMPAMAGEGAQPVKLISYNLRTATPRTATTPGPNAATPPPK